MCCIIHERNIFRDLPFLGEVLQRDLIGAYHYLAPSFNKNTWRCAVLRYLNEQKRGLTNHPIVIFTEQHNSSTFSVIWEWPDASSSVCNILNINAVLCMINPVSFTEFYSCRAFTQFNVIAWVQAIVFYVWS